MKNYDRLNHNYPMASSAPIRVLKLNLFYPKRESLFLVPQNRHTKCKTYDRMTQKVTAGCWHVDQSSLYKIFY